MFWPTRPAAWRNRNSVAKTVACGASKNCKHPPTNTRPQSDLFHDKTTCNLTGGAPRRACRDHHTPPAHHTTASPQGQAVPWGGATPQRWTQGAFCAVVSLSRTPAELWPFAIPGKGSPRQEMPFPVKSRVASSEFEGRRSLAVCPMYPRGPAVRWDFCARPPVCWSAAVALFITGEGSANTSTTNAPTALRCGACT